MTHLLPYLHASVQAGGRAEGICSGTPLGLANQAHRTHGWQYTTLSLRYNNASHSTHAVDCTSFEQVLGLQAFTAFMAFMAATVSTIALVFFAFAAFIAFMAFIAATVSTMVLVFFALAAFMAFIAFIAATVST